MKRIAFAAALAALLGTGCGTASPPPPPPNTAIDFSWRFLRYVNDTGGTLAYTCAQAGVDNVVVSFDVGGDVVVACADNAGDGARITGIQPGTRTVVVTGRRGSAALFASSAFTVDVFVDQVETTPLLDVAGIADNLYVYAHFLGQLGQNMGWTTCANAGVTSFDYWIEDYAGTVVAHATNVPCTNPAGVSFTGQDALDRDNYAIRFKGYAGSSQTFDSATEALRPYCDGQAFNHFGADDTWPVAVYDVTHNGTDGYGFCL